MSSRPTAYAIYGYDKDNDAYDRLILLNADISILCDIANQLSVLHLRRQTNNESYDWLEVVHEDSGARLYVVPCI